MGSRGRFLGRRSPVTVEQGQVAIDSIRLASWSRRHRVWEISFHSKYPELLSTGGNTVDIWAGEHTLKCDRDVIATRVTFPIDPDKWVIIAEEHGRYTMMVTAYRPRRRFKVLFDDFETGNELRYNRHGDWCAVCDTELASVFGNDYPTFGEDEHGNRFAHLNPHRDDHIPVPRQKEGL